MPMKHMIADMLTKPLQTGFILGSCLGFRSS